jgi:hypothetical protein
LRRNRGAAEKRDKLPPPHSSPRVNDQGYAVTAPASRTGRLPRP